jgi:DNA polymerase III subunit beta
VKFTIQQSELNQALSLVRRSVPDRPTHPVLGNFLIKASGSQVIVTGFDLSISSKIAVDADIKEEGAIAVPVTFADVISKLPGGEVKIAVQQEGEGFFTAIKPASGSYKVRSLSAEEYPELPEIQGQAIAIPALALQQGLRSCLLATSNDETKQILCGLHLTIDEYSVEFGATDGHRLAVFAWESEKPLVDSRVEVTVPSKALEKALSLIAKAGDDDEVQMTVDEGQAKFVYKNSEITSRTLEGQYPLYQQLIPKQFTRKVTVDRKCLISAVERVGVFSEKGGVLKLDIEKVDTGEELVKVSAEAQESGAGYEVIECFKMGDDIAIAFNIKYLLEGLKAMSSSEIVLNINEPLTPVIINPVGGSKHTYLIMPIQIRG